MLEYLELLGQVVWEPDLLVLMLQEVALGLNQDFGLQIRELADVVSDELNVVLVVVVQEGDGVALVNQVAVVDHLLDLAVRDLSEYDEL